jgi:hypothetical protein
MKDWVQCCVVLCAASALLSSCSQPQPSNSASLPVVILTEQAARNPSPIAGDAVPNSMKAPFSDDLHVVALPFPAAGALFGAAIGVLLGIAAGAAVGTAAGSAAALPRDLSEQDREELSAARHLYARAGEPGFLNDTGYYLMMPSLRIRVRLASLPSGAGIEWSGRLIGHTDETFSVIPREIDNIRIVLPGWSPCDATGALVPGWQLIDNEQMLLVHCVLKRLNQ